MIAALSAKRSTGRKIDLMGVLETSSPARQEPKLDERTNSRIDVFGDSSFTESPSSSNRLSMKTIVVWNPKGGCGKSTATVHLATAAELLGDGPVLVCDVDPQGTTADWCNLRKKAELKGPRYASLTIADIDQRIAAFSEAGAAYLFIDMMAGVGPNDAAILAKADRVLIPLNPKPADMRAMNKKLSLVRNSGKPFSFMLSRCRHGLRINSSTTLALQSLGLVLPTLMYEREIYSDTFAHGMTAFEVEPGGAASTEAKALWRHLKEKLDTDGSGKDE